MIALEYSVKDRTGRERLRTPDKKAAATFAKRMNHADGIAAWLHAAGVAAQVADDALYDITLHLACHPHEVRQLLRGQAASAAPAVAPPPPPGRGGTCGRARPARAAGERDPPGRGQPRRLTAPTRWGGGSWRVRSPTRLTRRGRTRAQPIDRCSTGGRARPRRRPEHNGIITEYNSIESHPPSRVALPRVNGSVFSPP